MATGELPFGSPQTMQGMCDRLWRDPVPPRSLAAEVAPWLQEIILRCLEISAVDRYQSAAYVAFDLRNSEQVTLTSRASKLQSAGFFGQAKRWWKARDHLPSPPRLPTLPVSEAPIIMVAVDTSNPDDPRHSALQRTTSRILSLSAEFRLICVSVIRAANLVEGTGGAATASGLHLEHLVRLRHWVEPLGLPATRLSLHVIESANAADTLLEFARSNNVNLIVIGAPGTNEHALAWWRSVASKVTANAHCSVHVVRVPVRNTRAIAKNHKGINTNTKHS
jgi:eukaryotic-like serine/threonine-protein kinase